MLADAKSLSVRCEVRNAGDASGGTLTTSLRDLGGREIARTEAPLAGDAVTLRMAGLAGIALWDIDDPVPLRRGGHARARRLRPARHAFGFRSAEFTPDGFA